MALFRDYEKQVLFLLLTNTLPPDRLNNIIINSKLLSYEYTGSGYFLNVHHRSLPTESAVFSEPIVIGETDGITCGFVVFVENNELTLECHSWGEINVPEDFREKEVQVRRVTIEEGRFVDLKDEEFKKGRQPYEFL